MDDNRMNKGRTFLLLVAIALILYTVRKFNVVDGFVDAGRCGVDLPSCASGLRCINGYCKSDVAPRLPLFSDLLMMP
jgi:hypothetical protein